MSCSAAAPAPPYPCTTTNALLRAFHDHEWGEPVTDPAILFEYLVLHSFQIGFNFPVILKYREALRELLAGFDPARIAQFGTAEITALLAHPRMLRSPRKLAATVQNAQAWLRLREEVGGEAGLLAFFCAYVGGRPLDSQRTAPDAPVSTPSSAALSRDLKRHGFQQLGPAACYALLQTAGLVNDHLLTCPRHAICAALAESGG
ncbi:MAG: DNA-3-methyladenine glycosylase I [Janthinobacterium lividum]